MNLFDIDTNATGRAILKDKNILGTEPKNYDSRNEIFVLFKDFSGKAAAVVVPRANGDSQPCYFGDLEYFATVHAAELVGLPLFWMDNGRPAWPAHTINLNNEDERKQYNAFFAEYKRIINKYRNK